MAKRVMHETAPTVPLDVAIQQAKDGDPTRLIHWAQYLRFRRNEYENKYFAAVAEAAELRARVAVLADRASEHDEGCVEWCNHCQWCGRAILYGSQCAECAASRVSSRTEPEGAGA